MSYDEHIAASVRAEWEAEVRADERARIAREVADRRESFLASDSLDPAWIAGWHSATDDHADWIRAHSDRANT